jgi:hypothetical protein
LVEEPRVPYRTSKGSKKHSWRFKGSSGRRLGYLRFVLFFFAVTVTRHESRGPRPQ